MQAWYGWVCLLLGAGLVVSQVVVSLMEARRSGTVANQAAAVQNAAQKVAAAASEVSTVAELAARQVREATGTEADMANAKAKAEAAGEKASEAEKEAEAAQGGTQWDFLSTLGGKVPLAVTGAVILLLGAVIMGYVALAASATASS